MLIDAHAHLNFAAFKDDFDKIIKRCLDNGIWMINIGTKYETSKKAVEIAEKYEKGVWAAIGLHPIHLETGLVKIKNDDEETNIKTKEENLDCEEYKKLAQNPKVVAIGEVGLDYYRRPKTTKKKELFKQKQKDLLLQQLNLAKELNLPVIFHCRMAHDDLYEFLISNFQFPNSKLKGVMHGFVGTLEQLRKYLEMGFYIGFNGIIFKNIAGIDFEKIIEETPLEKILIETDCPYLSPPGYEERNDPFGLKFILEKIAQVKNISFKNLAEQTTKNTQKLFGI